MGLEDEEYQESNWISQFKEQIRITQEGIDKETDVISLYSGSSTPLKLTFQIPRLKGK